MTSKLIWESTNGFKVFLMTTERPEKSYHFSFSSAAGVLIPPDEVLGMTAAVATAAFTKQKVILKRQLEHAAS